MEQVKQPKLTFHGVDILSVDFKAIGKRKPDTSVEIKCESKVFYPVDKNNFFNILMDMELKNEDYFELSLKAVGTFELESELVYELRKIFVNSNAPAIMFPYVRSFVSTLTANLGNTMDTLIIPTQFFRGELEEIR
jgi:preprotein translocase subunit SecB